LTLTFIYVALLGAFLAVYVWSLYNLPILATGVRNLHKTKLKPDKKRSVRDNRLPMFTILVPVKNEEKVIGRFLEAVALLNYPNDKKEIIIVEDGSTDRTAEICKKYAMEHNKLTVKILHKSTSNGKSPALNYGVKHARGEIIAIFDADNVPYADALLNACKYFEDSKVAAVQGRTMSINQDENVLTKFVSYEDAVWCEAYLRGKDALNLFVHLKGSCQFIRRTILNKLDGFDEKTLSEDMELSAKLTEKGYKVRYASDVCSWQETPASLKRLLTQRTRWFRGTMEVAFKYGRLMAKPSLKSFDAEATLFGPFILIASLLTYLASLYTFLIPFPLSLLLEVTTRFTAVSATLTLFICGLALIYASKPRKATNVFWLPFIYLYWTLQTFIAIYAVLLIFLRRPQKWVKTEKTGVINAAGFC